MLKIGYFADGPWSHKSFEKLITDSDIVFDFICARYDTRDFTLMNYAKANNIPYYLHKNINSDEFLSKISIYKSDLFVSMSFNQIFKQDIMSLPRYGIINCHAGRLPFYRGRNILNWVLINDEKEFGITVHYVDSGIDTGDIILQRTFPITDEDSYSTLLEKAYIECAEILYDAILLFKSGLPEVVKQNTIHNVGFYCTQRQIGDEILNWNQTSRNIFNFVRAISSPGPIARTHINNIEMKINKVIEIANAPQYKCINGAVLSVDDSGIIVKTEDGSIKIVEYEYCGKIRIGDRFNVK